VKQAATIVALLGPSGSGKTYLARLISTSLGLRFHDAEKALLEIHGSREAFLKSKQAALADLERELRARVASSTVDWVIEASGLSDGPMLRRLQADFPLLLVKVFAPRALCVERVRQRASGSNLLSDPDEARMFHDFWVREVAPRYAFDLEVVNDGASDARIVEQIAARLTPQPRRG
jgi:shikimate kinase